MTSVALDDIADLVRAWRTAHCRAARLHATAAAAEKKIMAALDGADVGTVAGRPAVRRHVRQRQAFAFAEFQAQHPDLVDQYVYQVDRERLQCPPTPAKEGDA